MTEDVRHVIDAQVAGVSAQELRMLDAASKRAAKQFKPMAATLRATNEKLDRIFVYIERTRHRAIQKSGC